MLHKNFFEQCKCLWIFLTNWKWWFVKFRAFRKCPQHSFLSTRFSSPKNWRDIFFMSVWNVNKHYFRLWEIKTGFMNNDECIVSTLKRKKIIFMSVAFFQKSCNEIYLSFWEKSFFLFVPISKSFVIPVT